MDKFNYTMLCDFYELTMGNGYFVSGMQEKISYFDLFFRQIPDGGGFAIACGLEQVINYIENLHFDEEDIEFLRSKGIFDKGFLEYLKDFRFTGDIFAVPEGTVVFPNEPIITVRAPAVQAQLVETYLLLCINHQTLIATKANRIVRAAQGRAVSEFGSRRAHGADAAILGARAAGIGGCSGTACTTTDQLFGFNATGTMAQSWVQMFDSEYEAFKAYADIYPDNCVFLVDTYNVLKSGVPNAIRVAKELEAEGHNAIGIRCDVSDEAQVKAAVEKAVAVFGKLDIAYNNVGIHAAVREDLAETEGWDFDRVISVNLRGVWNCMKYELVEMKKHGKGAIVNCSSQGGLVGIPCIGAYNASKHGVLGLTKSAALEYARQGIRINAICPGTCETPMVRQAIEQSPDHMARVIDAIALGRGGKAEEIASMVLLLCSDYAGFAIGQTWAMDGGYTAM